MDPRPTNPIASLPEDQKELILQIARLLGRVNCFQLDTQEALEAAEEICNDGMVLSLDLMSYFQRYNEQIGELLPCLALIRAFDDKVVKAQDTERRARQEVYLAELSELNNGDRRPPHPQAQRRPSSRPTLPTMGPD